MSSFFPERPPLPSAPETHALLRESIRVADAAMASGKHPFGCVLVGPDGAVLMEQGNIDTVNHAEATLVREAAGRYEPGFLWQCTLVTNFEPCCMCAGTMYWANIGRVLYGSPESVLLSLTGTNSENPTLALPCRDVFAAGSKDVQVIGPVAEMEEEVVASHKTFWKGVGEQL